MNNNFVQKFISGSIFTTAGTGITILFHFLSIIVLTRFVSPQELGLYFLLLAITNGGKIISSLGLDLTLTQKVATLEDEDREKSITIILFLRLAILAILSLIFYQFAHIILPFISAEQLLSFVWAVPALFLLMSLRELLFAILQGMQNFSAFAIIQSISAILKFGLIFAFSNSLSIEQLIYLELITLGLSTLVQMVWIPWGRFPLSRKHINRELASETLRYGFPIYISNLMNFVSNFGGVFIIGYFLNPVSIAFYEVAGKIPQGLSRLFASFKIVYFPSLSNLIGSGQTQKAETFLNICLTLMSVGLSTLILGSFLFGQEIILIMFSDAYLEVEYTFLLLVCAVSMQLLATTMGYTLVAAEKPRYSMIVNLIGFSFEFILSVILLPQVGYIGVAISFVATAFLMQSLSYFFLLRVNFQLNLAEIYKPILFLLIFAGLGYLLGTQSVIWRLCLILLHLGLCLYLVKACIEAIHYLQKLWNYRKTNLQAA